MFVSVESMDSSVLFSTFFLTLLLGVGLLFFIRASTKERIQVVTLVSQRSSDELLADLKQYFADRAYQVNSIDAAENKVTLSGQVAPSLFLAVFLSFLAGVGALCLGLVLSVALPNVPYIWAGLLIFAPLAGQFYWRKAGRTEQVAFKLDEAQSSDLATVIKVSAHRDELAELQRTLNLNVQEYIVAN